MNIVWTATAEEELENIFDFITEDDPHAAMRVYKAIRDDVSKLTDFPYIGRSGRVYGTREKVIVTFPYIVIYEISGEDIVILNVLRTSQDWPQSLTE